MLSFNTGIGIPAPLFLGYVRSHSAWQSDTAILPTNAASLAG